MTQLAIYIEDKLSEKLEKVVKASGKSKSKWIADVIKKELDDQWPENFFNLAGSWKDNKDPDEIIQEIRDGSDTFEKREEIGR
jgi:predicted DNA-binding protein